MKLMPKRIWVLLTVIVLVVGLLGMTAFAANNDPADEPVCYDHGDVNSDGAITGEDAVYLLFASFGDLFGNEYPLSQDGDLDGDGAVTGDDAVYLLFASFGDLFGDMYPLNGTIHSYYDPIWTWDTNGTEPTAQVSLKCACGENHTITEGIAITVGTVVDPTCVASGSKEYTGCVTFNSHTYENTVSVTVPALGENGHTIVGEPTCTDSVKCQNCDYTFEALGHSYVDNGEKVEGCKHTELYKCVCGSEAEGDVYYTHTYTAELVEEATCTKAGKKLLTCSCGDTQEEVIPINAEFHVWGEAVTENGVTTQTCTCGQTKTIVVMSDNGVSADALKDSEVQLDGGTSVALDENTADQLDADKSVVIKVEQVDKDETGMSDAEKEQVGNNTIYNFTMRYDDGTPITNFGGEVTVSLPYTLQEGDDVNAIDVWFIADDGTVECVKGVYSNNYVTFKTNHFSYYTVTRLTPEQRCAVYGHSIVERTKEATCTEDGYHKVFCQRCGLEEKNEVKGMLGHDYQKNEQLSEDATCNAPGKLATQCANCGHKRLQEVKQLSHKWSIETVAPTCSAKGYEKRTCTLCGTEKIDNEKEALGHSYSKDSAVWTWSDDYSKATVTLTCANDKTHTKDLNAVVTSAGGNACVGGQVTYTATASFNKITYTTTTAAEQNGIGHTPGSEWESSDEKHYHSCSVCGEPVGEASHTWERKVITAATCGKDGEATDTCSVCGKEKAVVLKATGEHSYKNGVCSGCGYVEGSCDHKKLTTVEIDLSEYGVCGGTVSVRVCSCGEYVKWYGCDLICDLEDVEDEIVEEQGYAKYATSCPDCGLKVSVVQKRTLNRENCSSTWTLDYRVVVGDVLVVETHEETSPSYHPMVVEHDPINLADFGLCAQVWTNTSCYCGLRSEWETKGDGCKMSPSNDGKGFVCTECGATGTYTTTTEENGCQYLEQTVIVYNKNGNQAFTATISHVYIEHSYKMENYEMDGDSCEDGVAVLWVCDVCGENTEEYYSDCVAFLVEQTIDTSNTASCTPGIKLTTCPCGEDKGWAYIYDEDETTHRWTYEFDNKTGKWIEICEICNFSMTTDPEEHSPEEKDQNCRVQYNVTYTYSNGEPDSTFTWVGLQWAQYHNYAYAFELEGESCEDGVTIYRTCGDCGLDEKWNEDYHCMYPAETVDLSEYGYCSGGIKLYRCACGEGTYLDADSGMCQWVPNAGDEGFEEWICTVCGITRQLRWNTINSDEPCTFFTEYEYTYLKNGEVLTVLRYTEKNTNHRSIYELALLDGAETCDDGYTVKGVCLDCGYSEEFERSGCCQYPVNSEIVDCDDLCGVMEIYTESCACGQYSDNGVRWFGDTSCDFYAGESVYNKEYDAWQYFCVCGASRIFISSEVPVEGNPCLVECRSTNYYFAPDGTLIAQYYNSNIGESHDWLGDFELLGDTCDDGWMLTWVCSDCGTMKPMTSIQYGCEMAALTRDLVYESDDICGPVYVYYMSCACGKHYSYTVETVCRGDWDNGLFTCRTCGLQHKNRYDYVRIPGTCQRNVTMTYTFMLDGQTAATLVKEFTETDHVDIYELILLGVTCEDGFRVLSACAFCDYEYMWEDVHYGHQRYCTEYYEAPEGSCGGYIQLYSCACGEEQEVRNWLQCPMQGEYITVNDEDGYHTIWKGKCSICGMEASYDSYTRPAANDCQAIEYVEWNFTKGEWTLSLSEHWIVDSHDWNQYKTELKVEGSQNCDDGITIYARCTRCSQETTWTAYGHHKIADASKTIDLAEYGSVCGAKLELKLCACGRDGGYVFSDDTECDIGSNNIEVWIESALDNSYITANGWESAYSYAYERYCAVTDPACDLRIRMASYWLNEDCTAVKYETWQIGYDPETGTCQKEITMATGNRNTYHAYEDSSFVETFEDGFRVWEYKYVCADCGSYYVDKYYYDENSSQVKRIRDVVNNLNDGKNKRYTQTWEYQILTALDDIRLSYDKLQRSEYVYADGSTYWYQNEYTYDIENGCKCTNIYSDSDGNYSVNEDGSCHSNHYSSELLTAPTCTQFGTQIERWTCRLCGQITKEKISEVFPNDHSWHYDGDMQIYSCNICGLENQNGTSGSIWMEDISDDTNYVVGYYCNNDITFSPYVSLILYDVAEGKNDELVLDSVVVNYLTVENDGVCGLSFNKTVTAEAAVAALKAAGYTGRYAVRISCVPLGGSHSLDYAVTFNTLTAE